MRDQNKNGKWNRREFAVAMATIAVSGLARGQAELTSKTHRDVYLVPNFHPASCGWLTTFSRERVYCANSYLNHLDRVRDDPNYAFVLSEVNNIIAIMNFQPDRIPELKRRVEEKRVELVNGYFLESTINLSGGEALVRLGVEGLRWYQKTFGRKPRYSWNIDVCGTHDQMPQIASGLGLEALIYTRRNPTTKTMFWSVSPDGSRILTLVPGPYSEASSIFSATEPLTEEKLQELEAFFDEKEPITPEGAPILVLGGGGDYTLAPLVKQYPSELLKQWAKAEPERKIQFTTLSQYVDAVLPGIHAGRISIPTSRGGTAYDFDAFWIENARVKTLYRRNEHALQAAEALATIASLLGKYEYPVQPLHESWIMMCLNMDRNTLWGSAGGMVFANEQSWDAQDRFDWVNKTTDAVFQAAGDGLARAGDEIGLFNPLNWKRNDPVALELPAGKSLEGVGCEALADGTVLCNLEMPAMSVGTWKLSDQAARAPEPIELPEVLETEHYLVRMDSATGGMASLKWKATGRELLAAPANIIIAERPKKKPDDPSDQMPPSPERMRLGTSSNQPSTIQVTKGPLTTTVQVTGTFFGGGTLRRTIRFHNHHPRIDFETELNDVPDYTVVFAAFPLADDILEVRRGIPYGFSHSAWAKPNLNLHGWAKGIVPAVRWSNYSLANGGGLAILDRGLSGRELNERTPLLYLMNAEDKYWGYDNSWLSGKGRHVLPYALLAYDASWEEARIPQAAWEYNRGPAMIGGRAPAEIKSYLETSDNVIVEALRREGDHIEMRLVECFGSPGTAEIRCPLPHSKLSFTDLTGGRISTRGKASSYRFKIRPQQIVTLHFETSSALPEPELVTQWDKFVPQEKLAALHAYDPKLIGHPPFGT